MNSLIYSPVEIATDGQAYLDARRSGSVYGIPIGLKSLDTAPMGKKDEYFLPVLPGELITVIGRPGNGKTGLMMAWARTWAQTRKVTNHVVVYIPFEQSVEELHAFHVAAETKLSVTDMAAGKITDANWEDIKASGIHRMELPLWFIGYGFGRRRQKARPAMTVETLRDSLQEIQDWNQGTEIDLVFVDFLQRIPFVGKPESKTVGHSQQLDALKDIALGLGTRMIVGVQASRDVDERAIPIPGMEDGQWTSNIEQASDGVLTVCRPRKYREEGETFGETAVKGHCQMIVTVAKRKLGADNFGRWVYFSPEFNRLDELEMKHIDLQEFGND